MIFLVLPKIKRPFFKNNKFVKWLYFQTWYEFNTFLLFLCVFLHEINLRKINCKDCIWYAILCFGIRLSYIKFSMQFIFLENVVQSHAYQCFLMLFSKVHVKCHVIYPRLTCRAIFNFLCNLHINLFKINANYFSCCLNGEIFKIKFEIRYYPFG